MVYNQVKYRMPNILCSNQKATCQGCFLIGVVKGKVKMVGL